MSKQVGLGILTYNLVTNLVKLDRSNNYIFYVSRDSDAKLIPNSANISVRIIKAPYPIAEQILLLYFIYKDRIDIFHALLGTAPILLLGKKIVATIADAMFIMPSSIVPQRKNFYQKLGGIYRRLVVPIIYKRAAAVVTISDRSKKDLERYLGDKDELSYIYLAAGSKFKYKSPKKGVLQKYGLKEGNYILSLAGIDPRKNTNSLVESYVTSGVKVNLVLIGELTGVMRTKVNANVVSIGKVSEEDLVSLYCGAKYFIYPSLYEGFGIPILEAMACGAPVLALDRGANKEIAGGAALLVKPHKLMDGLKKLNSDDNLRHSLIKSGLERAEKFSWGNTAREYLNVYRKVYR